MNRSTNSPSHTLPNADPALALERIRVAYPTGDGSGEIVVVDGVDLLLQPGESVGILGESGSGKTSLALAAVGMLPRAAELKGRIRIAGLEAPAPADERRWRKLRGDSVGFVFQQPSLALHPMRRCGSQIVEVLRSHRTWDRARCRRVVSDLLSELDLPPEAFHAFPHQLSGGQQQRVVLAQALVCEPDVLIADEPTTALDRETEKKVLRWVDRLRRQRGLSLLWISHDPEVLEQTTDRLYVMYAGRWVEEGRTSEVLGDPRHPYSAALLACRSPASAGRRLPTIPGDDPDPTTREAGCPFRPRCRFAQEDCLSPPPVVERTGRRIWCVDPLEGL